jgi:hypothetical protein
MSKTHHANHEADCRLILLISCLESMGQLDFFQLQEQVDVPVLPADASPGQNGASILILPKGNRYS